MKSQKYFFGGQYFDTFDEFIKGKKEFDSQQVNIESFEFFCNRLKEELELNLWMRAQNLKLTNEQLSKKFEEILFEAIHIIEK